MLETLEVYFPEKPPLLSPCVLGKGSKRKKKTEKRGKRKNKTGKTRLVSNHPRAGVGPTSAFPGSE